MSEEEIIVLLIDNPQEGLKEAISQYGATVHWIASKIIGTTYKMKYLKLASI
ncbi:MAG: hypothetical protein ACERKN_19035 [Velocimicrobium sp.]